MWQRLKPDCALLEGMAAERWPAAQTEHLQARVRSAVHSILLRASLRDSGRRRRAAPRRSPIARRRVVLQTTSRAGRQLHEESAAATGTLANILRPTTHARCRGNAVACTSVCRTLRHGHAQGIARCKFRGVGGTAYCYAPPPVRSAPVMQLAALTHSSNRL